MALAAAAAGECRQRFGFSTTDDNVAVLPYETAPGEGNGASVLGADDQGIERVSGAGKRVPNGTFVVVIDAVRD